MTFRIPDDLTALELLNALNDWGERARGEQVIYLWDILTALRGPDVPALKPMKRHTTAVLRNLVKNLACMAGANVCLPPLDYPQMYLPEDASEAQRAEANHIRWATYVSGVLSARAEIFKRHSPHFEAHVYMATSAICPQNWGVSRYLGSADENQARHTFLREAREYDYSTAQEE